MGVWVGWVMSQISISYSCFKCEETYVVLRKGVTLLGTMIEGWDEKVYSSNILMG